MTETMHQDMIVGMFFPVQKFWPKASNPDPYLHKVWIGVIGVHLILILMLSWLVSIPTLGEMIDRPNDLSSNKPMVQLWVDVEMHQDRDNEFKLKNASSLKEPVKNWVERKMQSERNVSNLPVSDPLNSESESGEIFTYVGAFNKEVHSDLTKNDVDSIQFNLGVSSISNDVNFSGNNEQRSETHRLNDKDSIQVSILQSPSPLYPEVSRQRGEQGVVWIAIQVNGQGAPLQTLIKQSSGFVRLDQAALNGVKSWRFKPQDLKNGLSYYQVEVPVIFKLPNT
jgi:TonB family protein